MNIKEARAAIEAILEAIPDSELPPFDKVETNKGRTVVWWGGTGHYLGSAKSGGQRAPGCHRGRDDLPAPTADSSTTGESAEGITLARKKA